MVDDDKELVGKIAESIMVRVFYETQPTSEPQRGMIYDRAYDAVMQMRLRKLENALKTTTGHEQGSGV